jgi:hypothetical protein
MVCSNIIGISSLSHSGQKENAGEKDPGAFQRSHKKVLLGESSLRVLIGQHGQTNSRRHKISPSLPNALGGS